MKVLSNLVKHPFFLSSVIMTVGATLANFLNYLFHLIIGRMLGPSDYGELVAVITLIGFLGMIPSSLNLVVVKYISAAKNKKEALGLVNWFRNKTLILSTFFLFLIIVTSPLVTSYLNLTNIYYLFLVAVAFFFSLLSFLNRSILQGLLRFKEMVINLLSENFIKLLLSIILVFIGFQVGGVMVGFVLSAFLGWNISNYYLRDYKKQVSVVVKIKPIVFFIIPVFIQSISITALYSSDIILVKHFFPSYEAGVYAALSTLGKIIFFGAAPISAVMFPLVSQMHSKGQTYNKVFIYSLFITSIFALSMLIVYWLFPNFIINLLYGTAYQQAAYLLVWFGIFITMFTISTLLINFYLSIGLTRIVILPLIASIIQIIGIYLFHHTLLEVIIVSIIVTALLLGVLLIYFFYRIIYGNKTKITYRNKTSLGYSSSL